jgi:hypothetical protein
LIKQNKQLQEKGSENTRKFLWCFLFQLCTCFCLDFVSTNTKKKNWLLLPLHLTVISSVMWKNFKVHYSRVVGEILTIFKLRKDRVRFGTPYSLPSIPLTHQPHPLVAIVSISEQLSRSWSLLAVIRTSWSVSVSRQSPVGSNQSSVFSQERVIGISHHPSDKEVILFV